MTRRLLALAAAGLFGSCYSRPQVEPETPDNEGRTEDTGRTGQNAPVSDVSSRVHDDVATLLEVSWTQDESADASWIEYTFENDEWHETPREAREAGRYTQVLLGVPERTEVTFRIANELEGETRYSTEDYQDTTGTVPEELYPPTVVTFDETTAHAAPWVMGSIDVGDDWYGGPCWVFIMDRQGRYVWYYEMPHSRLTLFPQVAHDGTHILFEGTTHYTWDDDVQPVIERVTLDLDWHEQITLTGLGFSFDEIEGGNILYDHEEDGYELVEREPDGTEREVWNCTRYIQDLGQSSHTCSPNSVVYNPEQGTVFWSMYYTDTVVEIDYESGEVVRRFGQLPGGWSFEPAESEVDYQHYPNYTPDGTIIASTHARAVSGVQFAREYVPDDQSQVLENTWTYTEEKHYARYGGEAFRLDNGNTFLCFGTDGAIREVTSEGETTWEVEWPHTPDSHLLGHFTYLDDLYALNTGG